MTWRLLFVAFVAAYGLMIMPFTSYLKNRPVEVKLGYLPHPQVLKAVSGEHAPTLAAMMIAKVLFYYGTIIQNLQKNVIVHPEMFNMYKTLQGVAHLDPYNMDTYYFAQAVYTWEVGRIDEVNHLLEQGMRYRAWDYSLPFYLGFNYGYFLKDYAKASGYMQKAAELSGDPLFTRLASRYFYESEHSEFALSFLEAMIQSAKDLAVRKTFEMRRDALKTVVSIEKARDRYRDRFGQLPHRIQQLVDAQLLPGLPVDPYGGTFYLDEKGGVKTTSKLVEHLPAKQG